MFSSTASQKVVKIETNFEIPDYWTRKMLGKVYKGSSSCNLPIMRSKVQEDTISLNSINPRGNKHFSNHPLHILHCHSIPYHKTDITQTHTHRTLPLSSTHTHILYSEPLQVLTQLHPSPVSLICFHHFVSTANQIRQLSCYARHSTLRYECPGKNTAIANVTSREKYARKI